MSWSDIIDQALGMVPYGFQLAEIVYKQRSGQMDQGPAIALDEQGKIIVPERDPAALARALDRLMGSAALRRQLGGFGRARALEHFTFDAAAAGLVRIWREALANR
mgnify:CR=1 FL=1